jgi:hypothetical protein
MAVPYLILPVLFMNFQSFLSKITYQLDFPWERLFLKANPIESNWLNGTCREKEPDLGVRACVRTLVPPNPGIHPGNSQ